MPELKLKAQAGPPSESADTNPMHLPWSSHVAPSIDNAFAIVAFGFLLQTLCRHNNDALTPLPGDDGALDHDQGHGHEAVARQLTMFQSAETLCFVTILFHDGFGSPRHAPMATEFEQGTQTHIVNVMYARCQSITAYVQCWHLGGCLRAWGKRKVSDVDSDGAKFLQLFINDMVKAIFAPPVPSAGDLGTIRCPSPWSSGANGSQPLPMTPSLLFNTSQVFMDDPMSTVIKECWKAIASGDFPGRAHLLLSSGTIELCRLGDLIVFLLCEVPFLAAGVFFAIGIHLLRHFAMFLQAELPRLVSLQPKALTVQALRGCSGRSFRLDPRRLIMAMDDIAAGKSSGLGAWSRKQETIDHDAAKILVWAYGRRAHEAMDIRNQSLVLMSDMAKGSGESMNLYFSYSPVINLGAWLPFQVTCLPHPSWSNLSCLTPFQCQCQGCPIANCCSIRCIGCTYVPLLQ